MKKRFLLTVVVVIVAYYYHTNDDIDVPNIRGKPLNVLKALKNGEFQVDKSVLQELFLHPEIKDRKPVIFSIVGDFRKGKSFLLDYFLRFMYANVSKNAKNKTKKNMWKRKNLTNIFFLQYKSVNFTENPLKSPENWMGKPNQPLTGFSWKSGSTRDTTGILFWSDIFLHTTETGENLAIFIVDSQGLFDSETSPEDNSRIFSLSTMISSTQILNIKDNLQENQLEYLQVRTIKRKFVGVIKTFFKARHRFCTTLC